MWPRPEKKFGNSRKPGRKPLPRKVREPSRRFERSGRAIAKPRRKCLTRWKSRCRNARERRPLTVISLRPVRRFRRLRCDRATVLSKFRPPGKNLAQERARAEALDRDLAAARQDQEG